MWRDLELVSNDSYWVTQSLNLSGIFTCQDVRVDWPFAFEDVTSACASGSCGECAVTSASKVNGWVYEILHSGHIAWQMSDDGAAWHYPHLSLSPPLLPGHYHQCWIEIWWQLVRLFPSNQQVVSLLLSLAPRLSSVCSLPFKLLHQSHSLASSLTPESCRISGSLDAISLSYIRRYGDDPVEACGVDLHPDKNFYISHQFFFSAWAILTVPSLCGSVFQFLHWPAATMEVIFHAGFHASARNPQTPLTQTEDHCQFREKQADQTEQT